MKRRVMIAVAIICIAFPAFAGGVQQPSETTSEDAGVNISAPGVYPIVEPMVELDFFAGNTMKTQVTDITTNEMTHWYEEFTNVRINWEVPPRGELGTRLNLSLASGDYPDVYWAQSFGPSQALLYASEGVMIPLNDLIEEHGLHLKKSFARYPEIEKMVTAPDGNIYTLYRTDAGVHMLTQQKMFVYRPWIEQLGISEPITIDDFAEMLQAFKDNDMNQNGNRDDEIPLVGYSTTGYANVAWFLMNAFVVSNHKSKLLNVIDGKVVPAYTQDEWKAGILFIRDLYRRGLIAKDSFVQDRDQLKALVSRPNDMIVGSSPGMYELVFANKASLPDALVLYDSIKPLIGPKGLQQAPYNDNFLQLNTAITSTCEYPEVALKWLDYWFSEEGGIIATFGRENVQWHYLDEPSIDGRTPSLDSLPVEPGTSTENTWWVGSGPRLQTTVTRYIKTLLPDRQQLESELYMEAQNYLPYQSEEYLPSILWGTAEEASEIAVLETNIWTYVNESLTQFIIGNRDVEKEWDKYLDELRRMGLAKYLDLYQAIFDR